jgi:hypothetical protein
MTGCARIPMMTSSHYYGFSYACGTVYKGDVAVLKSTSELYKHLVCSYKERIYGSLRTKLTRATATLTLTAAVRHDGTSLAATAAEVPISCFTESEKH